ncbi:MAG TPA: hypothetical protein VLB32_02930 [Candidatus Acidoferrales bacterium]|nr:hypothetical protein [Candidatus Acidoferrales bacterium]
MARAAEDPEAPGLREKAVELLRQAATDALGTEPRVQTKLLSDIASLQWKLGDRDAASKNFDLAQQVLETVQDPSDAEPPALYPSAVVSARTLAGDLDGAAKTLERIQDPKTKKQALESLAWARARIAKTPEEVETARTLVDRDSADRIASVLVAQRANQGDLEGARTLAAIIVSPKEKAPALLVLATTSSEIAAARALVDSQTADFLCSMSAYRRAEAGEFELARTFAEAVADRKKKAEVFESIATIEKRVRDTQAGLPPPVYEPGFFYGRGSATCHLEVRGTPELEAQVEAAIERALAQDFKGALGITSQMQPRDAQENMLVALTAYRAYKNDFRGARATAQLLQRNQCRAFALQYIATIEMRSGDLAAATSTIDAIPDSLTKGKVLTDLAESQLEGGKCVEALAVLEAAHRHATSGEPGFTFIPAPRQRAKALSRIAGLQARAGERALAAQTLAEAVEWAIAGGEEEGNWTTPEQVAAAHVEMGFIQEGVAFARVAPVKDRRGLIGGLMSLAGRRNQVAESLAVVDTLATPEEKAGALLGLAHGLETRATYGPPKK